MKDKIEDENISFKYNLIDMHTIDCEKLIQMDTPDSLVLSILCDFKGKDELEVLKYIVTRLTQLSKDDTHKFGKYMLMLETLSDNRDLKEKLKEVDKMLRKINYENLPSYELGIEQGIADGLAKGFSQGISQGISQGVLQGQLETASMMIKEFNIPVDKIAQKLNISVDTIKEYLEKNK